jgi:hypothetical protein
MKEAAGEANLTILAVVLIAIVTAVATPLISNMMNTTKRKSCCTAAGGLWEGGDCNGADATYAECIA